MVNLPFFTLMVGISTASTTSSTNINTAPTTSLTTRSPREQPQSIDVIVSLHIRLWQHEIFDLLIKNSSCWALTMTSSSFEVKDATTHPAKFVWRDNLAAKALPTDFGVLQIPSTPYALESLRSCLFRSLPAVKRVVRDGSPYDGRSLLSKVAATEKGQEEQQDEEDDHNDDDDEEGGGVGGVGGVGIVVGGSSSSSSSSSSEEEEEQEEQEEQDQENSDCSTVDVEKCRWSDGWSSSSLVGRRRGFKVIRHIASDVVDTAAANLDSNLDSKKHKKRTLAGGPPNFIPASIATEIHRKGYLGQGIKVGIFDSGLSADHPHFKHVVERTNWTSENTVNDNIGHGSFTTAVIAGLYKDCPGIAPESSVYIFRVFTTSHQSYTSWFLDAFNYALFLEIDVVNFSVGGPDYFDHPFTDKVRELSSHGIVVVSAVGNDGPLWGSIFNPADQVDVLSVGGWASGDQLASFSSRGMTTSEIGSRGMGRVKPDVLANAVSVYSSAARAPFGCVSLSGTSVAAPVVTGAVVALLSSLVRVHDTDRPADIVSGNQRRQVHRSGRGLSEADYQPRRQNADPAGVSRSIPTSPETTDEASASPRWLLQVTASNWSDPMITYNHPANVLQVNRRNRRFLQQRNVAAVKQVVLFSAARRGQMTIFEQGAGTLDVDAALHALRAHHPHASLHPPRVSNLAADCPYMWPWCTHRLYETAQPMLVNFTLLNSMGVTGRVVRLEWVETYLDGDMGAVGLEGGRVHRVTVDIDTELARIERAYAAAQEVRKSKSSRSRPVHPVFRLHGLRLTLRVQTSETLWPWSGFLAASVSVAPPVNSAEKLFTGTVRGHLRVTVESLVSATFPRNIHLDFPHVDVENDSSTSRSENRDGRSVGEGQRWHYHFDAGRRMHVSVATAELVVRIDPPPPRSRRLLWDVYHTIGYPSPMISRDDLHGSKNNFDWLGDHPYTNQRSVFDWLQREGFFVELLRAPWTCFNASNYLALVVVDPEETFAEEELKKVEMDVKGSGMAGVAGLSLLLVADWYDQALLVDEKYEDDNTRSTWYPVTAGANVPAINDLLGRFGRAAVGLRTFDGTLKFGDIELSYLSGNPIAQWPQGGAVMWSKQGDISLRKASSGSPSAPHLRKEEDKGKKDDNAPRVVGAFMQVGGPAERPLEAGLGTRAGGRVLGDRDFSNIDLFSATTDLDMGRSTTAVATTAEPTRHSRRYLLSGNASIPAADAPNTLPALVTTAFMATSNSSPIPTLSDPVPVPVPGPGRLSLFTDSSCFDDHSLTKDGGCKPLFGLLTEFLSPTNSATFLQSLSAAPMTGTDLSRQAPSTAPTAQRTLWPRLEALTLHAYSDPALMDPHHGAAAATVSVMEAHARGRKWEFKRVSKVERESDFMAACEDII